METIDHEFHADPTPVLPVAGITTGKDTFILHSLEFDGDLPNMIMPSGLVLRWERGTDSGKARYVHAEQMQRTIVQLELEVKSWRHLNADLTESYRQTILLSDRYADEIHQLEERISALKAPWYRRLLTLIRKGCA
jgi:hypothetical protein